MKYRKGQYLKCNEDLFMERVNGYRGMLAFSKNKSYKILNIADDSIELLNNKKDGHHVLKNGEWILHFKYCRIEKLNRILNEKF